MDRVDAYLANLEYSPTGGWAWANYLSVVKQMIKEGGYTSVLEVGGGRFPSLDRETISELQVHYTSNDISERELSLAPTWVGKAHFDIQSSSEVDLAGHEGQYDFVFSKMVMEHVPDYSSAYRNIHKLLKPGGTAIAFHPTLYAVPFVANLLLPETLSRGILRFFFPNRTDDDIPKFPAWYSGCVVSVRLRKNIAAIGFREVKQIPFYSHEYYRSIPGIRGLHRMISKTLSKHNVTPLASYCFTIVRK